MKRLLFIMTMLVAFMASAAAQKKHIIVSGTFNTDYKFHVSADKNDSTQVRSGAYPYYELAGMLNKITAEGYSLSPMSVMTEGDKYWNTDFIFIYTKDDMPSDIVRFNIPGPKENETPKTSKPTGKKK